MKIKYPRTPHLPFSPGITEDDKILDSISSFENKHVIITEKMDGECSTLYSDYYTHARSIDSSNNYEWRSWLKNFWYNRGHKLPAGYRVCGENLYATHSIHYNDLPSLFLVHSIWNSNNECLSWADTEALAALCDLQCVPVLYDALYDTQSVKNIIDALDTNLNEGIVIRAAGKFHYSDFANCVAKWVKLNHAQTDEHWMHKTCKRNKANE